MTAMLRYKWTSFGPMLDEDGPFVTLADAETAIDEARSQEAKVHGATERWSPLSHLQGQRDAIAAAVQRVEETVAPLPNTWPSMIRRSEAIAAIRDAEGRP